MPPAFDKADLEGALLFRGLTPEEKRYAAGLVSPQLVPGGVNVVSAGTSGDVVRIIVRGAVKIHLPVGDERDVILAILGRGEVIGEMSVLDNLAHSATATTIEETRMLEIDRASFAGLLEEIPVVNFNLAQILSRRLRMADAQIQALAALDLHGRVARQILAFAIEYGEPEPGGSRAIPFHLTQADLANIVGASRGRVNQSLGLFKRRGLITVNSAARLVVQDVERLARFCI
jgi:CRP/FNR family cyclic AMP-dependent transcriptional regulator